MSMFLKTIHSQGLSHLSYIIGQGGEAAVVDPRRDVDAYLDIAHKHGCRITQVFDTHRNEDYISGSREIARRTGADILHGPVTDFAFGNVVEDGDLFQVGSLILKVIQTPGHTFDSISLALYDTAFSSTQAIGVFTGDALFIGDVGRTDFIKGKEVKCAELLYDSLHEKLLPLGDQTLVFPAHGAGSVCGGNLAAREFSSLGYERTNNPMLLLSKEEFVKAKTSERHSYNPYFRRMEEYNLLGSAPVLTCIPRPQPLGVERFVSGQGDAQILDVRSPEAFAGAFIPGSLAVPLDMIAPYAGYFLDYERPILLVVHHHQEVEEAVRILLRMGFDNVEGYLPSMDAWEVSGHHYGRIPSVHVQELVADIEQGADFTLLDVRAEREFEQAHLPGAKNIYLGELANRLDEVDKTKPVVTFCGSGRRAIIGASILTRAGFQDVGNSLGSMAACASQGCPLE